jgi:hypothetical protein
LHVVYAVGQAPNLKVALFLCTYNSAIAYLEHRQCGSSTQHSSTTIKYTFGLVLLLSEHQGSQIMPSSISCGIRCIIGFCALNFILWGVAQTLAIWNYDLVASWNLQEPRSIANETVVATNQAIAMADTLIMLPLFAMSIVGLYQRKLYGVVCTWMVFGITLYWPVVWWMSRITYSKSASTTRRCCQHSLEGERPFGDRGNISIWCLGQLVYVPPERSSRLAEGRFCF